MNEAENKKPNHLTSSEVIENARRLTSILGGIFIVAGMFQALGWFEAGVPAWLNIGIAVVVIVLAQLLERKSLLVTTALSVIFLILAVDTLIATSYVFDEFGFGATVVVVVRYAILLSTTKSLVEVGKLLWEERAVERRVESLRARGATTALTIDASNRSASLPIKICSVIAFIIGLVGGFDMLSEGETTVGLLMLVGLTGLAGLMYYFAGVGERYLPGLVSELRAVSQEPDTEEFRNLREKIVAAGKHGSRALAADIVNHQLPVESPFVIVAAQIIAEIGLVDHDVAYALRRVLGDSSEASNLLSDVLSATN